MGDRRCCCDCRNFEDTFNRADAETLGDSWELIGDSEFHIENNKAKAIRGTALWVGELPDSQGSAVLYVTTADMKDGDVYEILFAWKDENNYMFVRVIAREWLGSFPDEYELSETFEVQIGSVVAGVESYTSNHDLIHEECDELVRVNNNAPMPLTSNSMEIKIWFDRNTVSVNTRATGGDFWVCLGPGNGKRVGIRHGGYQGSNTGSGTIDRPIYFDYFFASEHYVTNPTCPDRGCRCGGTFCLPEELTATLTHYSGNEAGQIDDPVSMTLYRRAWLNGYSWYSDPAVPGQDYMMGDPQYFAMYLICSAEANPDETPINQYNLFWSGFHSPGTRPTCWESEFGYPILPITQATLIFARCDPLTLIYELDCTASGAQLHHYDAPGVDYDWGQPNAGGIYRLTITE